MQALLVRRQKQPQLKKRYVGSTPNVKQCKLPLQKKAKKSTEKQNAHVGLGSWGEVH